MHFANTQLQGRCNGIGCRGIHREMALVSDRPKGQTRERDERIVRVRDVLWSLPDGGTPGDIQERFHKTHDHKVDVMTVRRDLEFLRKLGLANVQKVGNAKWWRKP